MIDLLLATGRAVGAIVRAQLQTASLEALSAVYKEDVADTIYQIDRDVEEPIVATLSEGAAEVGGIVLIAEGIGEDEPEGGLVLGAPNAQSAKWRVIIDPIDGTRGIMYDKRSAWFLAGAAPNHGPATRLSHIEHAVMVELPTTRSYLSDELWATRGQGANIQTRNLETGQASPGRIAPSRATTLIGGFGQIARFFAPGRALLAKIEDDMMAELYPPTALTRALAFEDQYISTGGQLYQVLVGHDRYVADIRKTLGDYLERQGLPRVFVCHPYDICTQLIALEAGIAVTDATGNLVDAPLDTTSPIDWIAWANPTLRAHVEPALQKHILLNLMIE